MLKNIFLAIPREYSITTYLMMGLRTEFKSVVIRWKNLKPLIRIVNVNWIQKFKTRFEK